MHDDGVALRRPDMFASYNDRDVVRCSNVLDGMRPLANGEKTWL